jgi:hypothetical protein
MAPQRVEWKEPPTYGAPLHQLIADLGADIQRGLTDESAAERLQRAGMNELA